MPLQKKPTNKELQERISELESQNTTLRQMIANQADGDLKNKVKAEMLEELKVHVMVKPGEKTHSFGAFNLPVAILKDFQVDTGPNCIRVMLRPASNPEELHTVFVPATAIVSYEHADLNLEELDKRVAEARKVQEEQEDLNG